MHAHVVAASPMASVVSSWLRTSCVTIAFCSRDTRQHTTAVQRSPTRRNSGALRLVSAAASAFQSMMSAYCVALPALRIINVVSTCAAVPSDEGRRQG
jgi:hypothetical protein